MGRCYSAHNISFEHADILEIEIPKVDLVLCKDVMLHLTNEDIASLLNKMQHCKHCLITNDIDPKTLSATNYPIQRGSVRILDLTKAPFNTSGNKIYRYWSSGALKQVLHIGTGEIYTHRE